MPRTDFIRSAAVVAAAAALAGVLTITPAVAEEPRARARAGADRVDQTPVLRARAPGPAVSAAQGDSPLETAIRLLLCLEARDAFEEGQPSGQIRQWVLLNGHRCQDAVRQAFEPGEF